MTPAEHFEQLNATEELHGEIELGGTWTCHLRNDDYSICESAATLDELLRAVCAVIEGGDE